MLLNRVRLFGFALALLPFAGFAPAAAQNPTQTARAFVPAPRVLAMGDAGVAVVERRSAYFYNPAGLALLPLGQKAVVDVSVQRSITAFRSLDAPYTYLRERLLPAIRQGIEALPPAQRRALFREAEALGAGRTSGGAAMGASVGARRGALGLGGGLYLHTFDAYQVQAGAGGIPELQLRQQHDASALFSGAFDFSAYGMNGLALGATVKVQHRVVAYKGKALDAFAPDEALYFHRALGSGLDLAGLYSTGVGKLPGRLRLGIALFDAASTGFEFTQGHTTVLDPQAEPDSTDDRQERRRAQRELERRRVQQEFKLTPSLRAGMAYSVPSPFRRSGSATLAIDVQHYVDPGRTRAFNANPALGTRLHAGLQVDVWPALTLRAGLAQGYPCAGFALQGGRARVEYAWGGQEDGRRPGDAPVWQHALRVGVSL